MNKIFLWLTDIDSHAKNNNKSYRDVALKVIEVANKNGYECRNEFAEDVANGKPLVGLSLEVDDIDGLCMSAGIDQDEFNHVSVDEWLSFATNNSI